MKALCAAAPECAVTELDIQGASDSDYLKAMHSCLDVQNCVGITSWGITDNTVSFDIFRPTMAQKPTLITLPTVLARRQDPSAVQQQRSAQVRLQCYPQRFVSVEPFFNRVGPGWRNAESLSWSIFSSNQSRISILDHIFIRPRMVLDSL